jgi:hypothetical protein
MVTSQLSVRESVRPGQSLLADLLRLLPILVQLALISLVLRGLPIEPSAFRRVIYLVAVGFVVHHLLPFRSRLPFFVFLCMVSLLLVLGGEPNVRFVNPTLALKRAGLILLMGTVLIGICRLPIGFWKRATLLLIAGGTGAMFRSGIWNSGAFSIIWPVLAAMFMFRIIVYLYDVSTSKSRPSLAQSLAYFFLIPNVCTLLFPVIDFRTFCQNYYNEDAFVIYQRGASWMARGLVHLLCYHFISLLFAISATQVMNGTDLVQFIIGNSLLYLQVSGSFHLVVGMLLLFGFNLPETNHRYFLASSFNDYWRRVNIYWRNFVMKVFYYPAFFRLKKAGQAKALVLATFWAFFATWALHLYQTFWLKGKAGVTWPDTCFWFVLGLLVLANSLWELKRGRLRKLTSSAYSLRETLGLAVRTATTFMIISLLWSLWSTPSLSLWFHILGLADLHTVAWGGVVIGCVMVATVLFEVLPKLINRSATTGGTEANPPRQYHLRPALLGIAPLLVIYLGIYALGKMPLNSTGFRPLAVAKEVTHVINHDQDSDVNPGYYENLITADEANAQIWETFRREPFDHTFQGKIPTIPVDDFRFEVIVPNTNVWADAADLQINRWGMRDKDYTLAKPKNTLRVALLGSSHVMGFGLPKADMFETILEYRLNAKHGQIARFQILNFARSGATPLGQIDTVRKNVAAFQPDIVMFVAHQLDFEWVNYGLREIVRNRIPDPYEFLERTLARAHVTRKTSPPIAKVRLVSFEPSLLSFTYQQIVQECHDINAMPVCVFLPTPTDLPLDWRASKLVSTAQDAGFAVIDLSHIYDGCKPLDLELTDAALHTNAKGNAMIADQLYQQFTTNTQINILKLAQQFSVETNTVASKAKELSQQATGIVNNKQNTK